MTAHATIRRRVRFVETDAAGIVHYSNFFRFMEEAEVEFWRSIGQLVHNGGEDGTIAWPRVEASCQFLNPLKFDDEFEVRMRVVEKKAKTLTMRFHIVKVGGDGPRIVGRGRIVSVCVSIDPATGRMTSLPIPPEIDAAIACIPQDTPSERSDA